MKGWGNYDCKSWHRSRWWCPSKKQEHREKGRCLHWRERRLKSTEKELFNLFGDLSLQLRREELLLQHLLQSFVNFLSWGSSPRIWSDTLIDNFSKHSNEVRFFGNIMTRREVACWRWSRWGRRRSYRRRVSRWPGTHSEWWVMMIMESSFRDNCFTNVIIAVVSVDDACYWCNGNRDTIYLDTIAISVTHDDRTCVKRMRSPDWSKSTPRDPNYNLLLLRFHIFYEIFEMRDTNGRNKDFKTKTEKLKNCWHLKDDSWQQDLVNDKHTDNQFRSQTE